MSKYRRKAKVDANQNEIVKQLRAVPGMSVEVGHDDILVGYRGRNFWYEIKSPEAVSKVTGQILDSFKKPSQVILEKTFNGHYKIVSCVEDILNEVESEF